MSSLSAHLLLFLTLIYAASAAGRPRALIIPVGKAAATSQYVTTIMQRTPLVPIELTVDLGGRFLWVDCETGYSSSTYRPARCNSAHCNLAKSTSCGTCSSAPAPGCNSNTCGLFPENPFISTSTAGELSLDVLSLSSTDGSNPGPLAPDSSFLFSCAPSSLLQGLDAGAAGMLGLGRMRIGTPTQLAMAFSFPRKFALCLPSSPRGTGVVFFGDGPYNLLPNTDASQSLLHTPLLTNPVSTAGTYTEGEPSAEYFIGVKSIKVNNKAVPLNKTLLAIDAKSGVGGTKISTVNPYTSLETSIYDAVTEAFAVAMGNVTRTAAVAPFELCYDAKEIGSTRVGAAVPPIDLVMQSESVYWRIFGANSMVEVSDGDVLCLGFVDGGANPRTSVVIGGYQIEDNLLQFDLAASRLGFSSSLLFRQTTCANFNFTTINA